MEFRIADTFAESLSRLTDDEQKAAKTTAFDLQMNPAIPGMQLHRIDNSKDKNFWSARVSSDIRLIIHRTETSLLLCYVDHHDKAYQWAERRKLETHPKTGAAQFVEVRERVQEIIIPRYVEAPEPVVPKPSLFEDTPEQKLLECGVPVEWLPDVRKANEDTLLDLAGHLPSEAAEALLELATGGTPKPMTQLVAGANPFEHPDALRRFRVMNDIDELEQALTYPWEKWTVFLHPTQKELVEQDYSGPVRVSGSAGTGKTIVALHRAVFLARSNPDARVLLTTFSEPLADALRAKLRRLISNQPRLAERLEVHSLNAVVHRLYEQQFGASTLVDDTTVRQHIAEELAKSGERLTVPFLVSEWHEVVDAWQLETWDAYRDAKRLGRKTRFLDARLQAVWAILDAVRTRLQNSGVVTLSGMFTSLSKVLATRKNPPFDFAIIDEAQDINISQLKFLASLGASRSNGLFFTGDLGQRIFQQPFSWNSLGVDVQGRTHVLHVNYRTSHQIRTQADQLLSKQLADFDGNIEARNGTISVFNGPTPIIQGFSNPTEEQTAVGCWLADRIKEGLAPHEIAVFVRSDNEIERARSAIAYAKISYKVLDEHVETTSGQASICTMHLAKGLEFRAVAVMACDDEIIPLQSRIEMVAEDSDLEEVYNTERHLLYVACTRTRDQLLVTGVNPVSEFLDDLRV